MKSGHVDHGLHYNLDLLPTFAEILKIDPAPVWDGQSYLAALRDGLAAGREFLVLSQCAHMCQRAVRLDRWIYIRTYHDGYHLFPTQMLFDLGNDPHEQFNLASQHPEICRKAQAHLAAWHEDMMRSLDPPLDPLWVVMQEGGPHHAKGQLKLYCDSLAGTPSAGAIEELRKRHPGEFAPG